MIWPGDPSGDQTLSPIHFTIVKMSYTDAAVPDQHEFEPRIRKIFGYGNF